MSTSRETVDFMLTKLRPSDRFSVRSMFGEYALYADGKTVGFVCDDLLYVKILPASSDLESLCEQGPPYPGAKPYYIVEEVQLSTIENLSKILLAVAASVKEKKKPKPEDGGCGKAQPQRW